MIKTCSVCHEEKEVTLFPLRKEAIDGYRGTCRDCLNKKARERDRKEYQTKYRASNKDKLSAQRKTRNRRIKVETMNHYGGTVCSCCGENNIEFLCFDHINGGGTKHRKSLGNMGRQFYYWLKLNNYPSGYRILCYNCNLSLGFYGYCPHNKEQNES